MSNQTKPQIVLVPGAAHGPECMVPLMTKLHALGYTTHCEKMASVGNPNPPADLSEDIAILRREVEDAIAEGNDVVVIPHSWGGIVASNALRSLSKTEREAQGQKGGVIRIGYIASFLLPEGASPLTGVKREENQPRLFAPQGNQLHAVMPELLYNDLPEDEQKKWIATLQTQALSSFITPATYAAWMHIPSSYLLCEEDRAIAPAVQEAMVKAAKEAGADMKVTRIKSGHSPFLSRTEETAEWIRGVAGEKV
ncbi:uncharacterized protein yc1106_08034 [Curvularia clavata]|uniref:AB hydrolase-1 domain-containing protein n=1 Tax=Curvularia clavata TaxID=95742 RepID=A0A9Q8ZEI1_CURCL|nr:uncharacterized protein yc1106_08034 [Curvularia clavata]